MTYSKGVVWWLWIGVIMISVQILVGGVTRLTGSGLSITKWEIVTGTVPPLDAADWSEEFERYKVTPQYRKINQGMSMDEFKFIYFWEYFHRLWARLFGLVFLFPFIYFLWKRKLDAPLIRRLGILVFTGVVVASFGWIMVASGLVKRPWVNAYKLSIHLNLGLFLFCLALWVTLYAINPRRTAIQNTRLWRWILGFVMILAVQLFLGGLMSGMKAGLFYPTWPDMNGQVIPDVVLDTDNWTFNNLKYYDAAGFTPAATQFMHRLMAYILLLAGLRIYLLSRKVVLPSVYKRLLIIFIGTLLLQVILGIITVINCVGEIPLIWGVLHQFGAILLIAVTTVLVYYTTRE